MLMRILKFTGLWLSLTFLFCVINNSFEKYPIIIQSINSLLFTTGYYFSYRFLIKPFLYERMIPKFIFLYAAVILLLSIISMLSVYQVYIVEGNKFYINNYWKDPVFYTSNYILIFLVTSSLLSFRFLQDKLQTQVTLENLEKEKVRTELDFLKAQINPHFLFNSLNNILFQIDKTNKNARETLLKFSEMLRYQLYDCSCNTIDI
jgi:two-component system LytT family sensor kinase